MIQLHLVKDGSAYSELHKKRAKLNLDVGRTNWAGEPSPWDGNSSTTASIVFLHLWVWKFKAPGHWWSTFFRYQVSSSVPVISETSCFQSSDKRHWKKTLMRECFHPPRLTKMLLFPLFNPSLASQSSSLPLLILRSSFLLNILRHK